MVEITGSFTRPSFAPWRWSGRLDGSGYTADSSPLFGFSAGGGLGSFVEFIAQEMEMCKCVMLPSVSLYAGDAKVFSKSFRWYCGNVGGSNVGGNDGVDVTARVKSSPLKAVHGRGPE